MPDIERSKMASDGDRVGLPRMRASTGRRIVTLATIALAFSVGFATAHVYSQHAHHADCRRWHENVERWTQVVGDATGELTGAETTALMLARGAMIAVRSQACGH